MERRESGGREVSRKGDLVALYAGIEGGKAKRNVDMHKRRYLGNAVNQGRKE